MRIKLDSSLLLNNMPILNKMVTNVYEIDHVVTKEHTENFQLKENEVTIFKIKDAIYHKKFVDFYYDKHNTKKKEIVHQKVASKAQKHKIDIYLTSKYIHFDSPKISKIKLEDILEIEVFEKFIVIYTKKNKSIIYFYSLELNMKLITLIEVLNNLQIGDDLVGKTVKFNVNKQMPKN